MRKIIESQYSFGNVDISQIKVDPKSRDEIDKVVLGLQYIFTNDEIRTEVFQLLDSMILPKISRNKGRKGMDLWKILVLGVIKQACSIDYDKLHHFSNNDLMIRELLGHDRNEWEDRYYYELQTLKDNISLLTPELLDKINLIVVRAGHKQLSKKKDELHISVDSFVVKTDIHFPSDISLLFDSVRKSVSITSQLCESKGHSGWRQSKHLIRTVKTAMRKVQKAKLKGYIKNEDKIKESHRNYITEASKLLERVKRSIRELSTGFELSMVDLGIIMGIDNYVNHGEYQIDLIERRIFQGESIPNNEKIHSIFEPHSRWISKGKAGLQVEFGIPTSVAKDQHGFILDYMNMEKESDVDVAVSLIRKVKESFPAIKSCSFDKGYWSPSNRQALGEFIGTVVMPKKGHLNKSELAEEGSKEFIKLRRKHSAVESSINGLTHSGLEKCYDHGITGFKRCVALSILSRNLHTLGKLLQDKEAKRKARKKYTKMA
jgi:hypothetical protein